MNKNKIALATILSFIAFSLTAQSGTTPKPAENFFSVPHELYIEPQDEPDVIIDSDTLTYSENKILLEGSVRATRENDLLRCEKAELFTEEKSLLATINPSFERKETNREEKYKRDYSLTAKHIYFQDEPRLIKASDTVNFRVEETKWEPASYTWLIITSDEMQGYEESERLIFSGNVKVKGDKKYGESDRLDYYKKRSLLIFSGNAKTETETFNEKKGENEKHLLEGSYIIYDTKTEKLTAK
ncbi:MAG: hypothetical protein GX221_11475 [Candidatus Riflebacteria bacterium]|nr:hypothetical protein [Candidatus Riflebacteria bacterium]